MKLAKTASAKRALRRAAAAAILHQEAACDRELLALLIERAKRVAARVAGAEQAFGVNATAAINPAVRRALGVRKGDVDAAAELWRAAHAALIENSNPLVRGPSRADASYRRAATSEAAGARDEGASAAPPRRRA